LFLAFVFGLCFPDLGDVGDLFWLMLTLNAIFLPMASALQAPTISYSHFE